MAMTSYSEVPAHEHDNDHDEGLGQVDGDEDGRLKIGMLSLQTELCPDLPLQPTELEDTVESSNLTFSVDEAIERLGMGRFQLIVLTAAGLCFAADAMQVLLLTFLSEVLRSDWNLNDYETALITSILFIGAIFGTLTLGPLADKKGRKPVFLLAATIISVFGLAVATVSNYWALLGNLFMVGWGVGGLTVPFDILAEFLPCNARGKNLLVIEYFWTLGVLFVVVIAYCTLGDGQGTSEWRSFVTICTIPCWVSIAIGYLFVPESPRWLCSQGRNDEAIEILRCAANTNGHDGQLLYPQGMKLEDAEDEESNFCELFSPRWRWTTFKLWGAWACFAFGYYCTVMATTEIFHTEKDSNTTLEDSENQFDYGAIFVSSSAELVGTTIAIFLVDTLGRIRLQVIAYALAGIFLFSLYFSAAYDSNRSFLIALGFSARIFEMTGSCVSWVSTAEILTTEVRTTGHSAANAVARIGALFSPFLIEGHGSLFKKGLIMLAIHAGTVVFVSKLPETKGTRMGSLQDGTIERDEDVDVDIFNDENAEVEVPCARDRYTID